MGYKKSHNDYWCERQIYTALANGCNIIEVDIIVLKDELILSHQWVPHRLFGYGSLKNYISFFNSYHGADSLYLLIELKTDNEKLLPLMIKYFSGFYNNNVTILIDAENKFLRKNAVRRAWEIIGSLSKNLYSPVLFWESWRQEKNIESIDLF